MDKTRSVDDFLGHEKSTNRRMHCITHNTHFIEHSTNLYFLIELILNFSDEKPISNAVEDWLNSQAPKRFDKYGEEIEDDIEYTFY